MSEFLVYVRYAVAGAFGLAVFAALGSWLVRTRRVSPFGFFGRTLRATTDPVVRPVETRLLRLGGNPVHAGWWLVVLVAIAGVLLLSLLDWLVRSLSVLSGAAAAGPRAVLALAVIMAYNVVFIALVVRVLGSWFGVFRYSRWMRPAYWLTDWVVNPIQRLLPPMGMFDLSPLAAWLVLWILKQLLLTAVL